MKKEAEARSASNAPFGSFLGLLPNALGVGGLTKATDSGANDRAGENGMGGSGGVTVAREGDNML